LERFEIHELLQSRFENAVTRSINSPWGEVALSGLKKSDAGASGAWGTQEERAIIAREQTGLAEPISCTNRHEAYNKWLQITTKVIVIF
jgi:hypothetical protein